MQTGYNNILNTRHKYQYLSIELSLPFWTPWDLHELQRYAAEMMSLPSRTESTKSKSMEAIRISVLWIGLTLDHTLDYHQN